MLTLFARYCWPIARQFSCPAPASALALGTRSISFILYLPDVEPVWEAQEGGALELYPSVKPSTPADHPSVRLLPK